jgi:hypothetical protein
MLEHTSSLEAQAETTVERSRARATRRWASPMDLAGLQACSTQFRKRKEGVDGQAPYPTATIASMRSLACQSESSRTRPARASPVRTARVGPADTVLPVDLRIPGCPPTPETIATALLALVDRLHSPPGH